MCVHELVKVNIFPVSTQKLGLEAVTLRGNKNIQCPDVNL